MIVETGREQRLAAVQVHDRAVLEDGLDGLGRELAEDWVERVEADVRDVHLHLLVPLACVALATEFLAYLVEAALNLLLDLRLQLLLHVVGLQLLAFEVLGSVLLRLLRVLHRHRERLRNTHLIWARLQHERLNWLVQIIIYRPVIALRATDETFLEVAAGRVLSYRWAQDLRWLRSRIADGAHLRRDMHRVWIARGDDWEAGRRHLRLLHVRWNLVTGRLQ